MTATAISNCAAMRMDRPHYHENVRAIPLGLIAHQETTVAQSQSHHRRLWSSVLHGGPGLLSGLRNRKLHRIPVCGAFQYANCQTGTSLRISDPATTSTSWCMDHM
jgi:hypothetical protein